MRVTLDAVDPIPGGAALSLTLDLRARRRRQAGVRRQRHLPRLRIGVPRDAHRPPSRPTAPAPTSRAGATTGPRAGARAGLDVLLTDAAVGRGTRRFIQPRAVAAVGAGVARHPRSVARRAAAARRPSSRASPRAARSRRPPRATGASPIRRGSSNWLLHRVMQAYLAVGESVDGVISDAELDWQTERQARFAASNVLDALAPTNFPWSNPAVLRAIVDEGGANLVRGGRRFAADVAWPPRLPQSVDTSGFEVGGNLARLPRLGRAAHRGLRADPVRSRPPRRCARCRCCSSRRRSTSTTCSTSRPAGAWSSTSSARASRCSSSRGATPTRPRATSTSTPTPTPCSRRARRSPTSPARRAVHVNASCSGGIITAGALGHLAAERRLGDVASLTLFVCALDNERAGTAGALDEPRDRPPRPWRSPRGAATSTGRRWPACSPGCGPTTWSGTTWSTTTCSARQPPAFDILYWNQDTVRLAAGLHRDFVRARARQLADAPRRARGARLAGRPRRGSTSTATSSPASTTTSCRGRTPTAAPQLLGGDTRFVLSTSGHIQALVNPPGAGLARELPRRRGAPRRPAGVPRAGGQACPGAGGRTTSSGWASARASCARRPSELGGRGHRALGKAPGTYVLAS